MRIAMSRRCTWNAAAVRSLTDSVGTPGCGASPAMRHILAALCPKTVVVSPDGLLATPRFHFVSPGYISSFCLHQRR